MKVAYGGLRTSCVASDDVRRRPLAAELALLAQAPRDVLGAGDRRVDDHRDGDREPAKDIALKVSPSTSSTSAAATARAES